MIRSMTGYGRGEYTAFERKFTVEIKSVNHRYNDITIKLPRTLNYIEDRIRKMLMKQIFRGKTDVYINFESFSNNDVCIKINEPLANAYSEKLNELKEKYNLTSVDTLSLVSKFPDIIVVEKQEETEDVIWNTLSPAIEEATSHFVNMREIEGQALKLDILKKSSGIKLIVESIKERSPVVITDYRDRLKNRINEILKGIEIDEARLATEVTIYADKGCIDEEITRLESHIIQLESILSSGDLVGRKLDFLVQEMNRESNTIASKSNDIQITQSTISLKSEIEKIREQIQNIE